jgi:RNA polymerase sigma factor (sigma-70 family)
MESRSSNEGTRADFSDEVLEALKQYEKLIHWVLRKQIPERFYEDCYQDCLVKFPEIVKSFDPTKGKFTTYLVSQLRGITTRYIREIKRNQQSEDINNHDFPAEEARRREPNLKKALAQLSVLERELIRLYYFDEMTLSEIGAIFSMNISTVHARISKIICKLRSILNEDSES